MNNASQTPSIIIAPTTTRPLDEEMRDTIVSQILGMDSIALNCIMAYEDTRKAIVGGLKLERVIVNQSWAFLPEDDNDGKLTQLLGNIEITINGGDLYDVRGYTVDENGVAQEMQFEVNDVFAFNLSEVLRRIWE